MHVINLTLIYSMYKLADIQVNVGMADFQHVVPVHAAQVRKRKQSFSQNDNEHLGSGTFFSDIFYLCGLQDYCNVTTFFSFFSLGKTTEGPAGATRGGLGRAAEGPRPSVQVPGLEPGRVRSPAGSGTNRATLVNIIFLLDGR